MKRHLEDLLDNALEMYDKEVLKNIQLKKQYEIMKMNAEFLIEKNDELNKKIKSQDEVINGMIDNEEKYCLENNRLNNIINELEKKLVSDKKFFEDVYKKSHLSEEEFRKQCPYNIGSYDYSVEMLDKLQELKGSKDNER